MAVDGDLQQPASLYHHPDPACGCMVCPLRLVALPNLILVLCLSLSIGMPLLKSLGFLPTMPQLNYKISALEQVLDAPELQQTSDRFHGIDDTVTYDHVSFAYQTTQPGPDGKPAVVEDEVLHDISFTAKAGQKLLLSVNLAPARVPWQNC